MTHWTPDARDRHPGPARLCQHPDCVADRREAAHTPPAEYHVRIPQRRENGQRR